MLRAGGSSLPETLVALALLGSLLAMCAPILGLFPLAPRSQQQHQGWLWLQQAAQQLSRQWQQPLAYRAECVELTPPPGDYTVRVSIAWSQEPDRWSAEHTPHCEDEPTTPVPPLKRLHLSLHHPGRPTLQLWLALASPPEQGP